MKACYLQNVGKESSRIATSYPAASLWGKQISNIIPFCILSALFFSFFYLLLLYLISFTSHSLFLFPAFLQLIKFFFFFLFPPIPCSFHLSILAASTYFPVKR